MLPKSFEQYKFNEFVNKAVIDLGFDNPTKIQERVFSPVLKGKNIVAKSQTGSGKSHSFLLPIFSKLDVTKKKTQSIILAPTRELSRQLYDMALHIASFSEEDIKITLCIGGQDLNRDIERVSNAPHIIIGTPTRVLELDRASALAIKEVESLVIDECDMMIDLGFMEDVDKISKRAAENCQFLVFSATIPTQMNHFLKKYLKNAQYIEVDNAKFGKIELGNLELGEVKERSNKNLNIPTGEIEVFVKKETTGFSGGIIGVTQVDDKLKSVYKLLETL